MLVFIGNQRVYHKPIEHFKCPHKPRWFDNFSSLNVNILLLILMFYQFLCKLSIRENGIFINILFFP